jgi:hypothetical protein
VSLTSWSKPAPTACRGGLEVVEHLPGLGANVPRPDQRPRGVEGDLPGDVDRPPGGHLDHVGVAGRVVHCLGIDEVGRDGQLRG